MQKTILAGKDFCASRGIMSASRFKRCLLYLRREVFITLRRGEYQRVSATVYFYYITAAPFNYPGVCDGRDTCSPLKEDNVPASLSPSPVALVVEYSIVI